MSRVLLDMAGRFRLPSAAIVVALAISLVAARGAGASTYYMTSDDFGGVGTSNPIQSLVADYNLYLPDETGISTVLSSGPSTFDTTCSLTNDGAYLYWNDEARIGRAKLDGSAATRTLLGAPTGQTYGCRTLAVDGAHIYYVHQGGGTPATIGRAKKDGSEVDDDFVDPGGDVTGLAVDSGFLYWSTVAPAPKLRRISADGTGSPTEPVPGFSGSQIAVHGTNIYWIGYPDDTAIGRADTSTGYLNPKFTQNYTSPGVTGSIVADEYGVYFPVWNRIAFGPINGQPENPYYVSGPGMPDTKIEQLTVATTTRPPLPVSPSQKAGVSVKSVKIAGNASVTFLIITTGGAGEIEIREKVKTIKRHGKRVKAKAVVSPVSRKIKSGKKFTLTLKPSRTGRKLLKAGRTLRPRVEIRFTRTDGKSATAYKTLTLKLKRTKKKR